MITNTQQKLLDEDIEKFKQTSRFQLMSSVLPSDSLLIAFHCGWVMRNDRVESQVVKKAKRKKS